MRRFCLLLILLICGWTAVSVPAETFKLANGQELTGEVLSSNEQGVQVKLGEGNYQQVPWANFSQDDLRRFSQNPKMQPLVEPFIEITAEERLKKTEVTIKEPPRLKRPASGSLLGALFTSSLGLFLLAAVYAANIYAGYEVALFRAQPPALVAGLSAIPFLGFAAPIAFLSMPTRLKSSAAVEEQSAEAAPAAAAHVAAEEAVNPMQASGAEHPAGLKLAHEEKPEAAATPKHPETVKYQRGQFTFNRRFFETKFPNFFGVVHHQADKDMLLVIKSSRGEYHGERISRIAANDLHLQVRHAAATEEVMIPFLEIQEVRFQHKDTLK